MRATVLLRSPPTAATLAWALPQTGPSRRCLLRGEDKHGPATLRVWAEEREFQGSWGRHPGLRPAGAPRCAPLPGGPALLTLTLVQEPREPMFANIPLNGSTWAVSGHSSRMVTSVRGRKDGRGVSVEPSRHGETPLAQPEQPFKLINPCRSHFLCSNIPFFPGLRSNSSPWLLGGLAPLSTSPDSHHGTLSLVLTLNAPSHLRTFAYTLPSA